MFQKLIHIALFGMLALPLWGQVDSVKAPTDSLGKAERVEILILKHPAQDQELILPTVVISNTGLDQLPGSPVGQLDEKALADHANGDLGTALAERTGVFIKSYGPGALATPSFRGTGAGHTQLYWDGLPLNSPTLGLQDYSLFPLSLFDNARLYLGGSNLLLGSGALGGSIDLGQRHPLTYQHRAEVRLRQEIGSFGTSSTGGSLAFRISPKVMSKSRAWFRRSRNDFPLLQRPGDRLPHAAFGQLGLLQEFKAFLSGKSSLSARLWYQESDRQLPGVYPSFHSRQGQKDRALRSLLEYWTEMKSIRFNLKAAHFYEETLFTDSIASIESLTRSHSAFAEANVHGPAYWFGIRPSGGLRVNLQQAQSEGFAQGVDRVQASAFAKVYTRLSPALLLSTFVRQEWVDNAWMPILPSLGIAWSPDLSDKGFASNSLRPMRWGLNVNRNYRVPTLNDLYWIPGGNPDLKSELSETVEGSFELAFPAKSSEKVAEVRLSAYVMRIENLIQWLPDSTGLWTAENVRNVFSRGGEARFSWHKKWEGADFYLQGNYAFTLSTAQSEDPNDPIHGQQLIYVPRHNANLGLRAEVGRWMAGWEQRFTGNRNVLKDGSETLPAFTISNFRLGREFGGEKMMGKVQIRVENIFNINYQVVRARPMPGRTFALRLEFDLNLASKP